MISFFRSDFRSAPAARTLACVLTCLLAGCAAQVKVDPVEPVAMPAGWSQNGGNATPMEPDLDWWRRFGSDELSNLVHEGQNNNYEIGAAVSRVRQAQVQAAIAGAPLLPEVDLSIGASRYSVFQRRGQHQRQRHVAGRL